MRLIREPPAGFICQEVDTARLNNHIRYEPDEPCSPYISLVVGLQAVLLVLAPTVLIVSLTVRSAGQDDSYLRWSVFAALIIGGLATAAQGLRRGRFGAGHLLVNCATPSYIAIAVIALEAGGPAVLALLTVAAALSQFALAAWLPALRRIVTPVVTGTVLMLVVVSVLPLAFDRFQEVPEPTSPVAGPLVATVTLVVITALSVRARGVWRLWTSLIGIAAGCAVSAGFGLYQFRHVVDAPWVGLPDSRMPGLDLTPGAEFWALLPAFVILSLVLGVKMVGDGSVIQQVSRRRPGATDFRVIQGLLNTNAAGVFLSGMTGAPPTTVYSASSAAIINLTGVAARTVGYGIGIILVILAFLPKITAILIAVPGPVMGAYLLYLMGLIFVEGMRIVVQDGLDRRKTLVVAIAFSAGVGVEQQGFFADMFGGTWAASLDTAMTMGALLAILMTFTMEVFGRRPLRIKGRLGIGSLLVIDEMLRSLADRAGWEEDDKERLRSAGEEALLSLLQPSNLPESDTQARLVVTARSVGNAVEMEFLAVFVEENLEDHLAYLEEQTEGFDDREMSFRLLRHFASEVRHRKYHGMDVVTVRVDRLLG